MRFYHSLVWAICVSVLAGYASANLYEGSLAIDDSGLEGTGVWATGTEGKKTYSTAAFSWEVSQNQDSSWHYAYQLDVGHKDVSHLIIGASDSFTGLDILNATGDFGSIEVDTFGDEGNSNPYIPGSLYGIKFDSTTGTSVDVSFDSSRIPVWGDFYAKGGKSKGGKGKGKGVYNAVWNAGFSAANPTALASNGSLLNHILVPDTAAGPVPEPAAMVFLGLGGLIALRSRKSPSAQ